MLNFSLIFSILIHNIYSETIQSNQDAIVGNEQYNSFVNDNDDLKVDLDISEDSYNEIISTLQRTKNLKIKDFDKVFEEFNKIASREYDRDKERNRVEAKLRERSTKSKIFMMGVDNRTSSVTSNVRLSQTRKRDATNGKVEYDSKRKHFTDAINNTSSLNALEQWNEFFNSSHKITSVNSSCDCKERVFNSIIENVKCFVVEFCEKRNYKSLSKHVWKISAIWMVVYLVIAVPLWFTRGMCSCCLCCKFFKPQQTIQEAKNYLLLNPPGILVTKKGGIVYYEPTEREKDCYEEFGHFLRTL